VTIGKDATRFWSLHTPLDPAHLMILSVCSISQPIDVSVQARSSPPPAVAPATPHPLYRKHTSTTIMHMSSPRCTDHCRPLHRFQKPSECHRRPSTTRDLAADDRNRSSVSISPLLAFCPLDLDPSVQIKPLKRIGMARSEPPVSLYSNDPNH
jgi:hypothetical protein